jgi:hypothetical protein
MDSARLVFRDPRRGYSWLNFTATDSYDARSYDFPNGCGGVTVFQYEHALNANVKGILLGRRVATMKDVDPEQESMSSYIEWTACPD